MMLRSVADFTAALRNLELSGRQNPMNPGGDGAASQNGVQPPAARDPLAGAEAAIAEMERDIREAVLASVRSTTPP